RPKEARGLFPVHQSEGLLEGGQGLVEPRRLLRATRATWHLVASFHAGEFQSLVPGLAKMVDAQALQAGCLGSRHPKRDRKLGTRSAPTRGGKDVAAGPLRGGKMC